jgi:hypothetical protein
MTAAQSRVEPSSEIVSAEPASQRGSLPSWHSNTSLPTLSGALPSSHLAASSFEEFVAPAGFAPVEGFAWGTAECGCFFE